MSSINTLDSDLLAELIGDIDCLGTVVLYLRAAKSSIRKAAIERNVSLDMICASVNQRLKEFGRLVEPAHIQAILDESEMMPEVPENIFRVSFKGRAPPTDASSMSAE